MYNERRRDRDIKKGRERMSVCVCVCVRERERDKTDTQIDKKTHSEDKSKKFTRKKAETKANQTVQDPFQDCFKFHTLNRGIWYLRVHFTKAPLP